MEISEQAKEAAAWIVVFVRNGQKPNYSSIEYNIQKAINQSNQEKDAEIAELKKWKNEDPRMLREQVRVADSAFNALKQERATLRSQVEELKVVLKLSDSGMLMVKEGLLCFGSKATDELMTERNQLQSQLEELKGDSQPWPLKDIVRKLSEGVDILFQTHNYDSHGWEELRAANIAAKEWSAAIDKAMTVEPNS